MSQTCVCLFLSVVCVSLSLGVCVFRDSQCECVSVHHCPQLEALQEQLRLLEEENEQLREEVRMGQRACSWAEGVDSPAPSFLTPGLST